MSEDAKLGGTSADQRDEYEEIFGLLDVNGDGALTRDEVARAMRTLGMPASRAEVDALFIKIDTDLSGSLDLGEFVAWASRNVRAVGEDDLRAMFQAVDRDRSGTITTEELRWMLGALRAPVSKEEAERLVTAADANGDGVIRYDEFVRTRGLSAKLCLTFGVLRSFKEILRQYTQLAEDPSAGFGTTTPLPYGKENAKRMGYDVAALPDAVWESSCACGNPFALGSVPEGGTVIDLGCGAGADLCVAAKVVGKTGRVLGVDMTPAMVEKARANAKLCGLDNVRVLQAPFDGAGHPDIPTDAADVVIANGTFSLSPRKSRAFLQALRALKPGGRLHLIDAVREGSAGEGSWCDRVAGAAPIAKLLELMRAAGFVACEHVGFTDYEMPEGARVASFRAQKPNAGA